jgi:cellulose synthase/poly-beta-1,6-N-acetylglucosamine synthase-like glycosyltransferase
MTVVGWLLTVAVAALTLHTVVNAALLPRPTGQPSPVDEPVSVLVPVRDEAHRFEPGLRSILDQRGLADLRIIVLDDGSTDGTADLVRRVAGADPRVRLLTGGPTPAGWLGKPYACHQLAAAADSSVLVFVDADVVLAPDAVAAAVGLLAGFDLVSPYPRLVAVSPAERLVQPLLPWSWLTFLPVRAMQRSRRASLAAAGGQFLVVRRAAYERSGGHAGVRDRVVDDVELARAVKRGGGRISLADGSRLATCRMYTSWPQLRAGYAKSLWAAFGSVPGAIAVSLALLALYALPPALAIAGAIAGVGSWLWAGVGGYGLAVLGRIVTARATGGRAWPDAAAHPIGVGVFAWLVAVSLRERRRGRLAWKGRPVEVVR